METVLRRRAVPCRHALLLLAVAAARGAALLARPEVHIGVLGHERHHEPALGVLLRSAGRSGQETKSGLASERAPDKASRYS